MSLYIGSLLNPPDVHEALQHLLDMPSTKPAPAKHRPQAVRQRCLLGIHAIIKRADERLCHRAPRTRAGTLGRIVKELSKKVKGTDHYLWYESRPEEVRVSHHVLRCWVVLILIQRILLIIDSLFKGTAASAPPRLLN